MNRKGLVWAGLAVWAVGLLAGLWLHSKQQLTAFDPQQVLASAASQPGFDDRFVLRLSQAGVAAGSIVHIQPAESCYCNSLTQIHKQELATALPDFTVKNITPAQLGEAAALLAALPALAIIDKDNQLRYLGPYATGFGCLTGNTLISQITSMVNHPVSDMATIVTDVSGCFCPSSGASG